MKKWRIATGSQMIVEGALLSGCSFFAGYPITPASGIYREMIERLPRLNKVAIPAPDEISALAYCIGASMRGYKAMTATSGPGFSLMVESLQYALMTEIPVVVVLVQRLGPSTGGATQGAQGDVLFSEFCISGGYTLPVFCPSTPYECYHLIQRAFYWAETLRSPVILLTDKEVAMTYETVNPERLSALPPSHREMPSDEKSDYLPYHIQLSEDIPLFSPVGGKSQTRLTGSVHNMEGLLRKNEPEVIFLLRHLQEKISKRADEMSYYDFNKQEGADTLLITYGITSRAGQEAVTLARKTGSAISHLHLMTLFPVPVSVIKKMVKEVENVVVAEENLTGQYRSILSPFLEGKNGMGINKVGDRITPEEILQVLTRRK